jgi:hypothetical protein
MTKLPQDTVLTKISCLAVLEWAKGLFYHPTFRFEVVIALLVTSKHNDLS